MEFYNTPIDWWQSKHLLVDCLGVHLLKSIESDTGDSVASYWMVFHSLALSLTCSFRLFVLHSASKCCPVFPVLLHS